MTRVLLFSVIAILLLNSCKKEDHGNHEHFVEKIVTDSPPEIRLPAIMWDILEEKKVVSSLKIYPNTDQSGKLDENILVGLVVRLREKTKGILGANSFELKSAKMGMNLDLANFIKKDQGTFFLSFEPAVSTDSSLQVLFMSNSIQRKDGDQTLGSGCDKILDITKSYGSKFTGQGLEVNVTDGRHVSLLAGTFLIRVSHENGIRAFTTLAITDSRFPKLQCGGVVAKSVVIKSQTPPLIHEASESEISKRGEAANPAGHESSGGGGGGH
ncbi:MAG: hypothetical protein RJB66_2529 [Pseudomonadota bacterium]|jgi:hypothetical protein